MLHHWRIDDGTPTPLLRHCFGKIVFKSQSPQVAHKNDRYPGASPGLVELLSCLGLAGQVCMDMLNCCSQCSSSVSAWGKGTADVRALIRLLPGASELRNVSQLDGRMKRWKRASSLRVLRFTRATGSSMISSSPGRSLAPPSISSTSRHSISPAKVLLGDIREVVDAGRDRGVASGGTAPASQVSSRSSMLPAFTHRFPLLKHLSACLQKPKVVGSISA